MNWIKFISDDINFINFETVRSIHISGPYNNSTRPGIKKYWEIYIYFKNTHAYRTVRIYGEEKLKIVKKKLQEIIKATSMDGECDEPNREKSI